MDKKELKLHAKALGIPEGSAEIFINSTLDSVDTALKNKKFVTESDITRLVVKSLKKFSRDFAYVYEWSTGELYELSLKE